MMLPLPKGPWLSVSADTCGPFPIGEYVLVVLDAYSRYPEIDIVRTTNTETIAHGIPEIVKTDNCATFSRPRIRRICEGKGILSSKSDSIMA